MCIRSQYLTLVAIKKGCQLLSQQRNQPSAVNMDSSIRLIKEIDIYDGMRLQKGRRAHKLKTHNKDSSLLASQILADPSKTYSILPTAGKINGGVILYDKMGVYKDSHYYILGVVIGPESQTLALSSIF